MGDGKLALLKRNIREEAMPYFSDEELAAILDDNGGDVALASYRCLIIKSEDTTLSVSGLSLQDTSKYFLRLAARFRPSNTGFLQGAT